MTTNQRIEALIAAEVKRIQAWNKDFQSVWNFKRPALTQFQVAALATYQARNPTPLADATIAALLDAARAALSLLDEQRKEANAILIPLPHLAYILTPLPHLAYEEGPIAKQLRAAIAGVERGIA